MSGWQRLTGYPLPKDRYVPGKKIKQEHRNDLPRWQEAALSIQPLQKNSVYLYGLDLYHSGFFYEAHEAWEGLWLRRGKVATSEGKLLSALILVAAAHLKIELVALRPALRMLAKAIVHLQTLTPFESFGGIPISALIEKITGLFEKTKQKSKDTHSILLIPFLKEHQR